jgi:CHAT domain-containing protein/tetratricopeptide (TPR) repeat protein
MNRVMRFAIPVAIGLAFSAGLAAGQPPSGPGIELKPKIKVSIDPEEVIKMYDHLTIKETRDWWRKYPSTEAEAKQAISDIGDAMKLMDESTRLFASRQIDMARQKMTESLASFHRVFVEDSLMLSDVYGIFGIMLSQAGDVVEADELFRRQRASVEKAFPVNRFPDGHQRLALALLTMGTGQLDLGRHAAAEKMFRDAMRMYEKHGPANPNGSDLTTLYVQLTSAVFARREFAEAEVLAKKALVRCEELCKSPDGRAEYGHLLAKAMNNLAEVLRATGDTSGRADQLLKDSLALSGPIGTGIKLRNQAELALGRGEWSQALALSNDALQAAEQVYPESQFRNGSPELISVLRTRGSALTAVGDRAAATQAIERCLKMVRAIYPDERCPDGHPELASTLLALGDVQLRSSKPEHQRAAAQMFRDSLAVSLGHTRSQAAYLAESEILQQLDTAGGAIDRLLSVSRPFDSRDYWYLWETKAAVMRIMDHRRRAALSSNDPAARELALQLQEARQALAANALAPVTVGGGSGSADLTRRKEELESRLYAALHLPLPPRNVVGPHALAEALPADAAFVDFWIYLRFEQDPAKPGNDGRRVTPHYTAFVMTKNGEPTRVDLGPAAPIHSAVDDWLARINRNADDPVAERQAASKARDLAWKQLEPTLAGKSTVYLCPDGVYGRLPFSALPDSSGEKVLLETTKFVEVPHGPGLIGHLRTPPGASKGPVLAVGAVDYGTGVGPKNLQRLPATELELASLRQLAGESRIEPVRVLTKTEATAKTVGAELPVARIAHFATHAEADVPLAPLAASETFARNKLIGCRLALSGANSGVVGLLSGEAIAGLRLNDLDLAVLSACKTAIGPVEVREGVFALRRAFHAAGCKAVVASLWSVEDNSTAALMTRFYHHLWIEHRQPDDALREAQLDLYRSPRSIAEWAEGRRGGAIPLPAAPISIRESLPRKWAGFQLSINQP